MNKEKLKPCPFCGADEPMVHVVFNSKNKTVCWVECAMCGAQSKPTYSGDGRLVYDEIFKSKIKESPEVNVAVPWNRRVEG